MAKDLLLGNVLPAPLAPVDVGDPDANAAIEALQQFPMSPHTPFPRPVGPEYEALLARAGRVAASALVGLLDDAAVATGASDWSQEHLDGLATKDRRSFKRHYEQCVAAVAVRKAYLVWLIGAVCNTRAGLDRVIEVLRTGTVTARLAAAIALCSELADDASKLEVADALDLREWDWTELALERVYRAGVVLLAEAAPDEPFNRYAGLLAPELVATPVGEARAQPLLYGLNNAKVSDPRWAEVCLVHLDHRLLANLVLMLLEHLPPDPSWVAPLCRFLPDPGDTAEFWHGTAIKALARAATHEALPWLVGALHASWMTWLAVFEGFAKVGDPAMAHVVRDWLATNGAPDRDAAGAKLIAELERDGAVPRPATTTAPSPEPASPRSRPVLVYAKVPAFSKPKLDSLATLTRTYAKAFAAADLSDYFERIAQRAAWMIPKRVNEARVGLGVTKLGGHPDLPATAKWPRVAGEPLTFLAQIDFAEAAPHLPEGRVPASGLLSLFMGNDVDGAAGYAETAKAIYTPAGASLVRHEVPDDFVDVIFQAATVRWHPTLRLPSPSNRHLTKLLKGAKLERYEAEVYDDTAPILPQLLGYRDHGYDAEEPATAQMLLQLPGDDQTEMSFGDAEPLAIYIAAKQLVAGKFSKVWPHIGD